MSGFGMMNGNLFSGFFGGGASGSSGINFLTDYAAIKNGSYYKLMKAYYGGNDKVGALVKDSAKETTATSKEESKKLTRIEESASGLKGAADKLNASGSKSVFNLVEKTGEDGKSYRGYDTDAIYKEVSNFVKSYNDLIDSADDTTSESVEKAVVNLMNTSMKNSKLLSQIGITINKDSRLSISEADFKKADMTTVKSLFQGPGSYGYQTSVRASMVDYAAEREASKANTYNKSGKYSSNYNYSYNSYI